MMTKRRLAVLALLSPLAWASMVHAAGPSDAAERLTAQRKALEPLAIFDGQWRGPAKVMLPGGRQVELTQTERVGSFMGGALRMVEGRGYAADGSLQFNAFAVISYSPQTGRYNFRSYAQGHENDFPLEVRPDGFSWSVKAGPATLRYTATVKDGVWTEIGERLVDGQAPVRTFEMTLRRVGPTAWPQDGAVPPQ